MELAKLQALDPGLRRRVLRAVAERCGATLDFRATERLFELAAAKVPGSGASESRVRIELGDGIVVQRSARELQFRRAPQQTAAAAASRIPIAYALPVPGAVDAPAFHSHFTAGLDSGAAAPEWAGPIPQATVRCWVAGDQVRLAYSARPKKVKEVLLRLGIRGEERSAWPVVVWNGRIIWMRGVDIASPQADALEPGPLMPPRIVERRLPGAV